VVFGEADFLPGITIDKYEYVLVVESLALGIDRMKGQIIDLLKEILAEDGITIRGVYERSDAKERLKEGMERISGFIGEPFDTQVPITENGVRYLVDVAEGQKTGFFLDQKYNRKAIWPMAKGARVLDCFTHTGSFALNAAAAGAADVTAVDASETALCQAERNAELNGYAFVSGKKAGESFSGEDMVNETGDTLRFKAADLVELLPAMEAEGDEFDLVILDPPAFAKSRQNVKNAEKGYRKINRAGMKLVKDGGYFATCSCSHFMTRELFEKMLCEAAREAHVRLRQIEARTQGPDHPILWTAAESSYLKFYIFQVIKN
jgi:23S rRNA (cytosine1962-C5)-methyltransferase